MCLEPENTGAGRAKEVRNHTTKYEDCITERQHGDKDLLDFIASVKFGKNSKM